MTYRIAQSFAGKAVLIVNDRLDPWPELQLNLQRLEYSVSQMTGSQVSAEQVIAAVRDMAPQLILLATEMAGGSGFDICQQLKTMPESRSIPVIFITHQGGKAERIRGFAVGAKDYIVEPFWVEEATARIQNQIANYQLQTILRQQVRRINASPLGLLSRLHRVMHQQTEGLREKNLQLSQEIHERELAEAALRREQQKSEQLLLNILPRAMVERLKQLQGTLAERFDEVTILFADIVNFTPLAAETPPLELVNWLNQIFSEFDHLAEHYGLEKIKTVGDAYMVVGGLPVPMENHAEAVMEMAIAMQTTAAGILRHDGDPLQLRIGINTGPVVAGVIGIRKFSYDLWGDAVNIASRMEATGQPGKIQVTEATYRRLCHRYSFESGKLLLIKGKGYMTTFQYRSR